MQNMISAIKIKDQKIAELEAKVSELRKYLIHEEEQRDPGPLDDSLREDFFEIQCDVERLLRRNYDFSVPDQTLSKLIQVECAQQQKFFLEGPFSKTRNAKQRTLLVRAEVYNILDKEFFSRPIFGVEGDLENNMAGFEETIKACDQSECGQLCLKSKVFFSNRNSQKKGPSNMAYDNSQTV